jgi:hypothetical protein
MGRIQESKERIRKEKEEMECVICKKEGGSDIKGVITLQSTPSGPVCPTCINRIVADIVFMKSPWTEKDLKAWGYQRGEEE